MAFTTLIVEDSPLTRKIIAHHFNKAGYRIVGEAENGAEGLRLFRERRPNVVTLDLMMPVLGGITSLEALRAMRRAGSDHVIVVVSVIAFEQTRQECLHAGAFDYIVKPLNQYSFEPLRRKLARAFQPPTVGYGGH
jgi:two-component system, chemotaxis family, chemotaxis protein CheY